MRRDKERGESPEPFSAVTIRNGLVEATLYPPDPEAGYYRGSRFDWSGVVGSLTWRGHRYISRWFPIHDPRNHDSILGPVEAFAPIGFEAARPGDAFLAVGIGMLLRPDSEAYDFSRPYPIADGGRWTTRPSSDAVEFVHDLADPGGYGYRYRKTVRLVADEPRMELEHRLENTGSRPLITRLLNHNFFTLDDMPTGPGLSIRVPFDMEPIGAHRGFGDLAELQGDRIVYRRTLETGEVVAGEFGGFGNSPADYDILLENADTGAGLRIRADRPIRRLYFWSIRTTACPEPYIDVGANPGEEFSWTISYELYEM